MKPESLKHVCRENAQAVRFLEVFIAHCHLLDDIIDQDRGPVTDEALMRSEISMILELTGNTWFLQHRSCLVPLIVNSCNAWLDANRWESSLSENQQRAADVLKGMYHEVVYQTAFLCGGWEHLRTVTVALREYDHDFVTTGGKEPV